MKTFKLISIILLASLALSACAPITGTLIPGATSTPAVGGDATTPEVPTSPSPGEPVSPTQAADAVAAAIQTLAAQLGIGISAIQVTQVEAVEWPDGCLGAGKPDEACMMVVTPGYRILLAANGASYEVHTDLTGKSVRVAQGLGRNPAEAIVVLAARQFLAKNLNVSLGSVTLVSITAVTWPDACLGVPSGRACVLVLTPGYKVVLAAAEKQYEIHTDAAGKSIILAPAAPSSQVPSLIWQSPDQPCQMASITPQGVSFGPCQGVLTLTGFVSFERVSQLAAFTSAYQSFAAETVAGKVTFTGAGQAAASPAEQRAIAEWARLVYMEAEGGRGGAAWGLAFSWHRQGGIAGFCDDLAVYLDGEVIATSCRGEALKNGGRLILTADQLTQLYAWIDSLQSFEVNQSNDPSVADGMSIILDFNGSGQMPASQADQQAILSFASEVFFEAS